MTEIQVTFCSDYGRRPLSVVIKVPSVRAYTENLQYYNKYALARILLKRHMKPKDMVEYGYTKIKARVYDPVAIEQEKAERYEQIKKERGWT